MNQTTPQNMLQDYGRGGGSFKLLDLRLRNLDHGGERIIFRLDGASVSSLKVL